MDFLPEVGFFLKPDLIRSLTSRSVEILPLLYQTDSLDSLIADADGLLIPGGVGDLNPELYGQKKKYDCVKVIQERCDFEYKLLDRFLKTDKPLLAICWGHQMLNVYLGGSLIQDINRDRPSEYQHEQKEPGHITTHSVTLNQQSSAVQLWGSQVLRVNSTHHQAVDRLSSELSNEGVSEDGLIECFRMPKREFAWGVQWHPERLDADPVIPSFLEACRRSRS